MTDLAIDVDDSEATEYIVNGLQPGTLYTFSVLAYTTSDGPRSIHLTVSTHSAGMYILILFSCCMANLIEITNADTPATFSYIHTIPECDIEHT